LAFFFLALRRLRFSLAGATGPAMRCQFWWLFTPTSASIFIAHSQQVTEQYRFA